jgi:hypothetical protein
VAGSAQYVELGIGQILEQEQGPQLVTYAFFAVL